MPSKYGQFSDASCAKHFKGVVISNSQSFATRCVIPPDNAVLTLLESNERYQTSTATAKSSIS